MFFRTLPVASPEQRIADPLGIAPHVTLARMRDASRAQVMDYVSGHNLFRSGPFHVDRFKLYSSVLGSQRAKYRVEAAFRLVDGAGEDRALDQPSDEPR